MSIPPGDPGSLWKPFCHTRPGRVVLGDQFEGPEFTGRRKGSRGCFSAIKLLRDFEGEQLQPGSWGSGLQAGGRWMQINENGVLGKGLAACLTRSSLVASERTQ